MNKAIDYEVLADLIAQKVATAPPKNDVVWDAEQCAEYMRVATRTFRATIAPQPSFPRPALCEGFKSGRWYMVEVIEWVRENRR